MNLLPHIAGRVFSTPLMITRSKLDVILGVLAPRLRGEALNVWQQPEIDDELDIVAGGIAVISILGTLVRRTGGLQAASGLMSYADIAVQLQAALDNSAVKAILLDIDSPGGEAGGVFDLADQIYAARKIKPVWAVANEEAFSAAYALAASAERLYVPRTGGVGSVGVIAMHLDQSQSDAEEGLKYTPIFAGLRKNDYSPHAPLSDPARAALQAEVDRVYEMFVQTVARGRGLTADAIRKTEAGLFFGEDGAATGLADKIGTFDDALADLAVSLSLNPNRKETLMSNPIPQPSIEAEKMPPDLEALKAEFMEKARAEAKAEAMAYVAEVHDLCALAGAPNKATAFIVKGASAEDVRRELIEAKAAEAETTAIVGHPSDNAIATAEAKIDTAAIYQNRNNQKGN